MIFLHRSHYCNNCKQRIHYARFTTKKFVEEELSCPLCKEGVISFWEQLSFKFIIPIIIGVSFFSATVIYGLWAYSRRGIEGEDIFIIILNLIIASTCAIYGNKFRLKKIPSYNNQQLENGLKLFRKQSLYVILFAFVSMLTLFLLDLIIFVIWKRIELAIR